METKIINVNEKVDEVKRVAIKAAKYAAVGIAGAGIGAGAMWAITHGQADKVVAAVTAVADNAVEVIPEAVEAAV